MAKAKWQRKAYEMVKAIMAMAKTHRHIIEMAANRQKENGISESWRWRRNVEISSGEAKQISKSGNGISAIKHESGGENVARRVSGEQ
jgi:hypothetical protein